MSLIVPDRLKIASLNRVLPGPVLLHASGDDTRTTSSTTAVTVEQVTIPGGLMGPNGFLIADMFLKVDATPTNNYRVEMCVDGLFSADEIYEVSSKGISNHANRSWFCLNDTQKQAAPGGYSYYPHYPTSGAVRTHTVDTENDFEFYFRFKFDAADSARTMTLLHTAIRIYATQA